MRPIELRVNKFTVEGSTIYTIDRVYPGIGNVEFGQRTFTRYSDVREYCKREWNKIPVLKNY